MAAIAAEAIAMLAWAGCAGAQQEAAAAVAHPAQWSSLPEVALVNPATEKYIDGVIGRMSLEEKIGQMVQADIAYIKPDDLRHYKLGSILAGGLSAPGGNLRSTPEAWRHMVAEYREASLAGSSSLHPAIPILFGIDAVHGNAKIRGATIFPHNVGLGAAHDPDLIRRIGAATAQEVAALGIDWAFAPTVAVARDARWGRAYESYSDDPDLVGAYASAMVTGLQGKIGTTQFFGPGHVLSSAKHFIGDGGTDGGRDQGDTLVTEDALREIHGAGYRAAIAAGVGTVMASYNSWNGTKMHANASLLTGVLKDRWQFRGFVIGDWDAQEEIPGCTKYACATAVNAGIDMVMAPDSWRQMYASLLDQARAGLIQTTRIEDAVRRILRVKAAVGLLAPGGQADPVSAAAPAQAGAGVAVLGSPEHRALAREAVRKSLVLLKNNAGLLPLNRSRRVLVVGEAADRIAEQAGGWTVDWQGANNTNADIVGATSIYAGIKAAVEQGGGSAQLSADGSFTQKPDVAIVVYGEHPYAEFEGDRETLALPDAARVRTMLLRYQSLHIPVVSVLLSGRPLWVNPELNLSDAFVAAWLPGSEGEGVADLLFRPLQGAASFDFTGRLSFPWPATAMPVAYDAQGHVSGALFARGSGLSAANTATLPPLPEDPQIPPMWNSIDTFYSFGHVIAPYSIYLSDDTGQVRLTRGEQASPAGAVKAVRQDGAVSAEWSGKTGGSWWVGDTAVDLAAKAATGMTLSLSYRVTQAPSAKMLLGLQCGDSCAGWIDVTTSFRQGASLDWQTLQVPLACFATRGADLRHISVPFALATSGRAAISIRNISLAPGPASAGCPTG